MLIEIVREGIQVNVLSRILKKKGYEFLMKVGAYSCESRSDAKNMLKAFEMKYKLEAYEVIRPMFDLNGYARDVLQIGSVIKHVTTIQVYWVDCKDELENRDHAFARLTVEQVKTYGIDLNVEGLEDDGKNMYSNTYLTKIRNTHISFEHYVDVEEYVDVMMALYQSLESRLVLKKRKDGGAKGYFYYSSPIPSCYSSSISSH